MHKPLLQSNKLTFWVSWGFMMVWLVMVKKVLKKSASVRKTRVHWKCLEEMCQFEQICHQNSPVLCLSSPFLIHPAVEMLLEGFITAQISRAFKLLGYLPPRIAAQFLCSGNLFSSAVRRVYWTGLPVLLPQCSEPWGWSPGHPASHHPEWGTRNSVLPFFPLASGQALAASCVPGCVTTETWGANYSEGTAVIYPC